jgi:hypothetical protein
MLRFPDSSPFQPFALFSATWILGLRSLQCHLSGDRVRLPRGTNLVPPPHPVVTATRAGHVGTARLGRVSLRGVWQGGCFPTLIS